MRRRFSGAKNSVTDGGKLDRNFMGMPKEAVGASNDAKGGFGPPKFADARFSYKGGRQELTIHLQYLLAPL